MSIGFITLFFIKQKWPYPSNILALISIALMVIFLILGIREKTSENTSNIDWKYFLRIFVALVPLIATHLTYGASPVTDTLLGVVLPLHLHIGKDEHV